VKVSDTEFAKTEKKQARSNRVNYASPVVIVENTKTKIEALAYFYSKDGQEHLSLKLNFYSKDKSTGSWQSDKPRSFSLAEGSVEKLKAAIANFEALLDQETNQEYLLVPVGNGSLNIGRAEKQSAVRALLAALTDPQILTTFDSGELDHEILRALQGRVRIAEMEKATNELSLMLEADEQAEQMYQQWFNEHFWVMGNAYVAKDEVRSISKSDQVDLLLKCTSSGKRDIVELKKPNMAVLNYDATHRNYYFSSHTSQAIGQCQRYLEVFTEEGRYGLRDARHVLASYPEAIIIIGRSHDWDDEKQSALRGLNSRLSGIKVITYDHVLARAFALLDVVRPLVPAASSE
tara:strand:+ start:4890 stop:5933 length:1044 start_codon:yes stop_codon:yes gene_type:complete